MPQKAHLNGSKKDPPKGIFWPQKCHFPDFPILTSVGGPWEFLGNNSRHSHDSLAVQNDPQNFTQNPSEFITPCPP